MTKFLKTSMLAIALIAPATSAFADNEAGKKTYDQACAACHTTGVAGSPKLGDIELWSDRIENGKEALYTSAIKGKGAMPAKGGQIAIPDEAIKAAVDYMVDNSTKL
ncbi:UNVERIFIED_CONTAM: hypothetical protein GTU68_053621 [Idotea baltica]|nr:hypothetical protein [Idotea baltica]